MNKSYLNSPIGILEIICENGSLMSLKLVEKNGESDFETPCIINIKKQLSEYFSGKRQKFDIKINPKGTEFQKLVWNNLQKISYGKTTSYSEIAEMTGKPHAQRAVGLACNKNPIMIIIPCHRIISKNGNLGGFAYGIFIKKKLLNLENVT
jgi:methylated-DNA-[protein]-cysteine S-methyltransferase